MHSYLIADSAINGCKWMMLVTLMLCLCQTSLAQDKPSSQERAQAAETLRLELYKVGQQVEASEFVGRDPEKDLQALEQFPALLKACEEAEKEYATEIASQVQPYRNLIGTIGYCRERIEKFNAALAEYASPTSINEDADKILKSAKQSIEYQAPAYFKPDSDIARSTKSMKLRLKVLEKLKPDSKELNQGQELANKTAAEVRKIQMQLLDGILSQNDLPTDSYTKGDRKELLKLVEETWTKQVSKDKPLRVGLIGDSWVRTEAWEIQNRTAYKIDRSRLQGFVVLPNDNKTVMIKHIQLQRDHTNQDKTTAWPISDPQAGPEPMEMVLKSKLK
jgi:hypothetical protein